MRRNGVARGGSGRASLLVVMPAVLLAVALAAAPASAQTVTYGTLSNFDVFNHTGQECHGFEIELHGISGSDVVYTFGAPWNRYGDPAVEDFPGGGGVYVRYRGQYNPGTSQWMQATPQAPPDASPTGGHSCYQGGPIGNYETSGCEHYGVSLTRNATKTVYRWLVADPANPGQLVAMGNNVQIPAPVWNVAPNPVPEAPPVVAAVIPAEPPEVAGQWGEPQWMKSFKTEIEHEVELEDLLSDDPHVPREVAETEIEWFLLQADPDGVFEVENEAEMGDGNKSVIRRYEFYEYTGPRNPEDNEADPRPFVNGEPDPLDVGQYIGAQNAAVNVGGAAGPLALGPAALPFGELGITYSATVVSGGTTPYQFTVLKGAVPPGLSLNPATGALSGTPTEAKQTFRFTVEVTDQDGTSVTGVVKIHIMKPVDIATNALKTGKQDKTYKATVKAKLGVKPYSWALVAGTLPAGVTFNALTGVLSGTPTEGGTFEPVFQVTDTLGGQADRVLPITIKAVALPVLSSQ